MGNPGNNKTLSQFQPESGCHASPDSAGEERWFSFRRAFIKPHNASVTNIRPPADGVSLGRILTNRTNSQRRDIAKVYEENTQKVTEDMITTVESPSVKYSKRRQKLCMFTYCICDRCLLIKHLVTHLCLETVLNSRSYTNVNSESQAEPVLELWIRLETNKKVRSQLQ